MKKLVIWDLFGGSQNSVKKSLEYFKDFEVYTFDTNEDLYHDKQYICDLSSLESFEDCIKKHNIPKPDIIAASPLCTAFSVLMVSKDTKKGERIAFKFNQEEKKYEIRSEEEIESIIKQTRFFSKSTGKLFKQRAYEGIKLLETTIKIIQKYRPMCWYIENPATSIMWDYIKYNMNFEYYKNVAHYNSYDLNFSLKPTCFFSNWILNLKAYNIKNGVRVKKQKDGNRDESGERVKIPHLLIIEIMMKFKSNIQELKEICKVVKD